MPVIKAESARIERRATFAIPAARESVALARKMTDAVLRTWACAVDRDAAILLVDEIFTNAVLHGVGTSGETAQVTVELFANPQGLHVEVHDPDRGAGTPVTVSHAGAHSESGRGLELVEALSNGWGSKDTADGKYVYFDLAWQELAEAPRGARRRVEALA